MLLTLQTLQPKVPPLHRLSLGNPASAVRIQGTAFATNRLRNATCLALSVAFLFVAGVLGKPESVDTAGQQSGNIVFNADPPGAQPNHAYYPGSDLVNSEIDQY